VNSQSFAYFGDHRLFVGKLARQEFGIHQLVVERQFKTAAAGGLQLQALKTLFVLAENLGRQTDGLRLVVSSRAVAQMDFHVGDFLSTADASEVLTTCLVPEPNCLSGLFSSNRARIFSLASWP
jgi:hypothetical protein